MKILNMVDPNKSQIKFKVNSYPDGQNNLVINISDEFSQLWLNELLNQTKVQIKSRLNNWLDLELITCAVASLRELGVEEIHLYTPYIIGARSDRKFEEGGNNYLKDVICPIINSLNFKTVTCIDSHSDVLEACIKGFRKEDNKQLLGFAINDIYGLPKDIHKNLTKCILVSPDAGASKKIYKLAEQIGYSGDIITCSKDRDENGKLTKCVVNTDGLLEKDIIIIDDICDGGATFINIAKEIKDRYEHYKERCPKIYLIVTHGIFSKGTEELSKYFDGIYTTNSYEDMTYFDKHKAYEPIIKQLNVF